MSPTLKIKILSGSYKDKTGTLKNKIPGGNYFKVEIDNEIVTALHVTEFERIPNNELLFNELEKE